MKQIKNKKGFTLVELLLVVGLIALGAVVAYITFPKVQATSRANTEATNINTIASGINNLYAGTNTYASLGTDGATAFTVLNGARQLPERMISGTRILNGFGGDVTITAANLPVGATTNNFYLITYAGVPTAECTKLASGVGNNFVQVGINGTTGTNLVKEFPNEAAIDPGLVAAQCRAGNSNTMYFWGR